MEPTLVVSIATAALLGITLLPRAVYGLFRLVVGRLQRKRILASPLSITRMLEYFRLRQDQVRDCRCTLCIHVHGRAPLFVPATAEGSFSVAEGVWVKTVEGPAGHVAAFTVHAWDTASGQRRMARWIDSTILNAPTSLELQLQQLQAVPTRAPAAAAAAVARA